MHEIVYIVVAIISALIGAANTITNLRLRAELANFHIKVLKDVEEKYLPRETFHAELRRIDEHLAAR